jgi:hypothetical protein
MPRTLDQTLTALRANAESQTSNDFWTVYLGNARGDMSPNMFRSHLPQLAKSGDYKPKDDKYFGSVRMEPSKTPSNYR